MRVITFGEIMLRFAPEGYNRLFQTPVLNGTFGGGEANVAVSIANFGGDAAFVTKLPENAIAEACIRELRGFGVDTKFIARGGERMGVYYMEKGASCRPSNVIYDRAHSSISTATDSDFDWDAVQAHPQESHLPRTTLADFKEILLCMIRELRERGVQPVLMTLPPIDAQRYLDFLCREGRSRERILDWLGDTQRIYRHQELYSDTVARLAYETGTPLIGVR